MEQNKKDLGGMARELLTPDRLRRAGVFNPEFVERLLAGQPKQRLRWHYFMLWQMIGFELWNEIFIESPPAAPSSGSRGARADEGSMTHEH